MKCPKCNKPILQKAKIRNIADARELIIYQCDDCKFTRLIMKEFGYIK